MDMMEAKFFFVVIELISAPFPSQDVGNSSAL